MSQDSHPLIDAKLSPREKLARTRALAEQGDAEAQYQVGFRYYLGDSGAQDFNAAERWYTLAAEQGHTEAQYKLARMKAEGRGIDQNAEQALHWYGLAAAKGHAEALYQLGCMVAAGQGTEPDPVRAYGLVARSVSAVDRDLSTYLANEGLDPTLRGAVLAAALGDAVMAAELEVGLDQGRAMLAALGASMSAQQLEAALEALES